ncbi:MAG: hypothetical protein JHC93_07990 [Parachlamydiales bacterium]|nr:hypothetical protein [Parachlamydiales bacterium]
MSITSYTVNRYNQNDSFHSNPIVPFSYLGAIIEFPKSSLLQQELKAYAKPLSDPEIREDVESFMKATGKTANELYDQVVASKLTGAQGSRISNIVYQMKQNEDSDEQVKINDKLFAEQEKVNEALMKNLILTRAELKTEHNGRVYAEGKSASNNKVFKREINRLASENKRLASKNKSLDTTVKVLLEDKAKRDAATAKKHAAFKIAGLVGQGVVSVGMIGAGAALAPTGVGTGFGVGLIGLGASSLVALLPTTVVKSEEISDQLKGWDIHSEEYMNLQIQQDKEREQKDIESRTYFVEVELTDGTTTMVEMISSKRPQASRDRR